HQHTARGLLGVVGNRPRGQQHRLTGGDGLAAGECAKPERDPAGITRHDGDVLRAQAKLARAKLRARGTQGLSDLGGAGEYRYASRIRSPHQAGLEWTTPGALDAVREPDAEIAALSSRGSLTLGKVLPTRRLQDLRLRSGIIAAVVAHTGAGARLERLGIGHLLRRNEIAATP